MEERKELDNESEERWQAPPRWWPPAIRRRSPSAFKHPPRCPEPSPRGQSQGLVEVMGPRPAAHALK